jgi:hypothetical protein
LSSRLCRCQCIACCAHVLLQLHLAGGSTHANIQRVNVLRSADQGRCVCVTPVTRLPV